MVYDLIQSLIINNVESIPKQHLGFAQSSVWYSQLSIVFTFTANKTLKKLLGSTSPPPKTLRGIIAQGSVEKARKGVGVEVSRGGCDLEITELELLDREHLLV